jgi:hypothetical protein
VTEPEVAVDEVDDLFTGDRPGGLRRLTTAVAPTDLVERAAAEGWVPLLVDLTTVVDKADLLERVAAAAAFPAHVGRNWDALQDALGDLSWLGPVDGYLVVLVGWDGFGVAAPGEAAVLDSVLAQAAAEWADRGTPLVALAL